ncbi:MAG: carbon starvation protein A [Bacteroidales bacterium]|nr:carbon starvation protein A [Bacteroidales bacterium]MCF8397121.1 carbon starvation protein A [Bacteroidales bacterium]
MHPLLLMLIVFVGYILMYRIYGRFISKKIFDISKRALVPSHEKNDGFDYVPTKKEIIFGHHFASIAGTGPIVGPAIAIIWGWVPAILWVFFGSIFIGAVHDFGVLITSMRNHGDSIASITGRYINRRTKVFFFIIGFLELWMFIAILGMVMAIIFSLYPGSVLPVWLEIPIAVLLGFMVYNNGKNYLSWSILAIIVMYLTVILGKFIPIGLGDFFGLPHTGGWTIILLIYAFIASVLPVTTLLQPRDFINSHQLLVAMGLMIVGVVVSSFSADFQMVAPAYNPDPSGAPSLWPFIFIIIACGAVSGFHAIVSSGTSSKQVDNERDSLFVGYGSMLMEGALATLVILAVAAGIGMGYTDSNGEVLSGIPAWTSHYASWGQAKGLVPKISAFVDGSANMIASTGLPKEYGLIIMGVFVASFAGTSLDTSTRLQRYFLHELFGKSIPVFRDKYFASAFVVVSAAILAFASGADGKGALLLWPLFVEINQVLAGLALLIVSIYLYGRGGRKWLFTGIPAIFMGIVTLWAAILNHFEFKNQQNVLLTVVNVIIIILAIWIIAEGVMKMIRFVRKPL